MAYLDTPDTIIMQLTLEGRNLLARCKFGSELIYRNIGWQLGRGGYIHANPVHVEAIVDSANEAVGYIEILDNTFDAGDAVILNSKSFILNVQWAAGPTIPITVENIIAAVQDSEDPLHHRLVNVDVDPLNPNRIRFTSTVTGNVLADRSLAFPFTSVNVGTDIVTLTAHGLSNGLMVNFSTAGTLPVGVLSGTDYFIVDATANTFKLSTTLNAPTYVDFTTQGTGTHSIVPTGNLFPLDTDETIGFGSTLNFLVTPMALAVSTSLLDPAFPVPPTLGTFILPEGRIETPTSSSASFVVRVPDGPIGMNAYGEIGLWVEVLESIHPMEKGRKVLYAHGHFPIQAKTDRHLFTYRAILNF